MQEYCYDVVVVGGGPAGSSAAYAAAKEGARVALLEKEASIAQTVRTSGVTWISDMEEFGVPEHCYNPIRRFSFCSPGNSVTISDSASRAAVLDVRKAYRWLAGQAEEHGADLFLRANAEDALKDKNGDISGVTASTPDGPASFLAGVVIDASGFASAVCRSMNLAPQWKRFGAGAECEARADCVEQDRWWLMVGNEYSPAGYAWIFPVNAETVRIGVGIGKPESGADPAQRLKDLMDSKRGPIAGLGEITPVEFHYGLIPNDGLSRRTVFNGLILVGDSAGQANPLVLEGIRYAIRFGRVAGRVAGRAALDGRTDAYSMAEYEECWKNEIGSKIGSAGRVQKRWVGLSDAEWDRELDIIKDLTPEEFLDFIRADFSLSYIVKLAAHHPRLAARHLFGMIRRK